MKASNAPELKGNSFFAGIGGFDLGLERAGIHPQFQCEIDQFATSVLRRHWSGLPRHSDISTLDAKDVPPAEIWTGGFPCQDVSVARGRRGREGLKGKNSGLFFPFYSLVQDRKPTIVMLENVSGLLSSHKGKDFFLVLRSLSSLGYGIAWRVMNTRYYGAPQSRPRVYIVAWLGRPDLAAATLYEPEPARHPGSGRSGFITADYNQAAKAFVPQVSYCLAATSGRHTGTDWSRSYVAYHDAVRRLTPKECEGLQGFPSVWSYPAEDYHLTLEEIDTLRYQALGNAVSVPVVSWIANRLKSNFQRQQELLTPTAGEECAVSVLKKFVPDFCEREPLLHNLHDEPGGDDTVRWSSGGVAFDDTVLHTPVSPAPCKPVSSRFSDVIETGDVSEKYYLSPNAARGILRRVDSQKRSLFPPLDIALRRLAGYEPQVDQPAIRDLDLVDGRENAEYIAVPS